MELKVALWLPAPKMDLEALIAGRIDTWVERRTSKENKVQYHANESIANVQLLEDNHPLKQELNKNAVETAEERKTRKLRGWRQLLAAYTGKETQSGGRQIIATSTGIDRSRGAIEVGSMLEDREVSAELKKATLRWSIFRFSVRQVLTEEGKNILSMIPQWPSLTKEEKEEVRGTLFTLYNEQQRQWGMRTIETAGQRICAHTREI